MLTFLTPNQASSLRKMVRPYKHKGRLGKPWMARTEDELWRRVLSQIVVVGRAEPGYRLQHDKTISRQLTIRKLEAFKSEMELQTHLHRIFLNIGVRYAGNSWRSDRKALAGARNFRIVQKAGGPRRFFGTIAKLNTEKERIAVLQGSLKFYGDKGSRDTLIELRLATDCRALDIRIFRILEKVGLKVAPQTCSSGLKRNCYAKWQSLLAYLEHSWTEFCLGNTRRS